MANLKEIIEVNEEIERLTNELESKKAKLVYLVCSFDKETEKRERKKENKNG